MSTKKTTNPFLAKLLKEANKTENDKLTEKGLDFLENAKIDCEQQISERKVSLLPRKQLNLKKAELSLKKAKQNLTDVEISIPKDYKFETYFSNLQEAEEVVFEAEFQINEIQTEINLLNKEIEKLEKVLVMLNS